MEIFPRRIKKYVDNKGRCPFDEWSESLRDKRVQAIVAVRLNRLTQGNLGLCKRLDAYLWEFKIDYGPGFRVYFAEDKESLIVLLCGGDKSTQRKDIEKAKKFWRDYVQE